MVLSSCQPEGIKEVDPPEDPVFSVEGHIGQNSVSFSTGEASNFHCITSGGQFGDSTAVYSGVLTKLCGSDMCGERLGIDIHETSFSGLTAIGVNGYPKLFEPRQIDYAVSGPIFEAGYFMPIPFYHFSPLSGIAFISGNILDSSGLMPIDREFYIFSVEPDRSYGYTGAYQLHGGHEASISVNSTTSADAKVHGVDLIIEPVFNYGYRLIADDIDLIGREEYIYQWRSSTGIIKEGSELLLSYAEVHELEFIKVEQLNNTMDVVSSITFQSNHMGMFLHEVSFQGPGLFSGFVFTEPFPSSFGVTVTYFDEFEGEYCSSLANNEFSEFEILKSEYYQNPITSEEMVLCDIRMTCQLFNLGNGMEVSMENFVLSFAFGIP